MIDTERIVALRSTLAADGYLLQIAEEGTRVHVTISATPQACADCLVPKDLMRGILGQALDVPEDAIDLAYPRDPPSPPFDPPSPPFDISASPPPSTHER